MNIYINKIIKNQSKVSYEIFYDAGLEKYIKKIKPFFEYQQNLDNVPESILVVPLISCMLPMIFVLDVTIHVPVIDETFYLSIEKIRGGYQKMIPQLRFKGNVLATNVERNEYECKKNILLFSGGIDAMNSIIQNYDVIDDLVTIWGSDISVYNDLGWNKLIEKLSYNIDILQKKWTFIKSNFREWINENELTKVVDWTGDSWWHGYQHGISLIGHVAPLAYLNGYKIIFIASSFTKDYNPICASNPLIDNEFKCGSTICYHDGFEFDRCEKLVNIFKFINQKNINFRIHVCWQSDSGENCCNCEKCYRSYLNCVAIGEDPSKIGLPNDINLSKIKKLYLKQIVYDDGELNRIEVIRKHFVQTYNRVPKKFNWIIDTDFKDINNSFYWKIKKIYRKILNKY